MRLLQPYDVYLYLLDKLKVIDSETDFTTILKNGTIDKSASKNIGIFRASSTRDGAGICLGGYECTPIGVLPIDIYTRWGTDSQVNDAFISKIYEALATEDSNIISHTRKIAYIKMMDDAPISLGRDENNICESSIRVNFVYYL
jgi:hypothetical protein